MGFLDALVESSIRFASVLYPIGYTERKITWVINISTKEGVAPTVVKKGKDKLPLKSPTAPADRTSGNVSPALLVDKVSYVTGLPDRGKKGDFLRIAQEEHHSFIQLLQMCAKKTNDEQVKKISNFLQCCSPYLPEAKAGDLCAFQIEQLPWPTDSPSVQSFWSEYVAERLAEDEQQCVICRQIKPITRIQPFKVTLMKGTDQVQLSSFNLDAFQSLGKTSIEVEEGEGDDKKKKRRTGANAAICYSCASTAGQVLQHLVLLEKNKEDGDKSSGRHAVVLARDDSKGKGKQSLKNQIAVFWTKEQVDLQTKDLDKIEFEDLAKVPIEDFDEIPEEAPPVKVGQCRALLESPFIGGRNTTSLSATRFFLAVLSPNKSRLVVREWLETDIEPVRKNIKRYMDAVQIIHPDGRGVWWPPLPAMLEALQSYTSVKQKGKESPRVAALGPDVTRKLIRCIYTGISPPEVLLTRAVRCFRVPDPPTDNREQKERQMRRRMAMAAAMKLVLTYDKDGKEQKAMEELKPEHDGTSDYKHKAPYNCGVLLAILEAVQRRASSSGRGVNTTLVDRFYGAASTAPATVFANLINMATKAHLPKLRREGKELFRVRSQVEGVNINELMQEACAAIDNAGGFPSPLTPKKQAEFALGFYHQRAELNPPKSKSISPKNTNKTNTNGGKS
ncbi:MAG: type I-C CRISPR-associated protein Cas8c/Csd1 [Pseudomonadota bacterium]